jgi:hypothetical protein
MLHNRGTQYTFILFLYILNASRLSPQYNIFECL